VVKLICLGPLLIVALSVIGRGEAIGGRALVQIVQNSAVTAQFTVQYMVISVIHVLVPVEDWNRIGRIGQIGTDWNRLVASEISEGNDCGSFGFLSLVALSASTVQAIDALGRGV